MDFPILDIRGRPAQTAHNYFISTNEVLPPVMKGIDLDNNLFIILRTQIVKFDGTRELFYITFFQMYSKFRDSSWGSCVRGEFMYICNKISLEQVLLTKDLIEKTKLKVSFNTIDVLKVFDFVDKMKLSDFFDNTQDIKSIEIF